MHNLLTIASYNGFCGFIKELSQYITKQTDSIIPYPSEIIYKYSEKEADICDQFPNVFWSWLVLEYGDYGTSPRFGWIDKTNKNLIIRELENFCAEEQIEEE